MVSEPPYGVNYDPAWRNQAGRSINGTTQRIATGTVIKPIGARAVGKVVNDGRADWREAWALFSAARPKRDTSRPSCSSAVSMRKGMSRSRKGRRARLLPRRGGGGPSRGPDWLSQFAAAYNRTNFSRPAPAAMH
jgi:hypothetical protein